MSVGHDRDDYACPARAGPADAFPATSRSRTAMRCSRHSPTGARDCAIMHQAPTASRRSPACAASASTIGTAGDTVTLVGRGFAQLRSPAGPLDAGNSGTTMRMLAGVLAGQPFTSTMVGDESLSRRPMRRVIEPLAQMGARIEAADGHAPLTVHGTTLHADCTTRPTVPSAQVKSAVLLAGLHAEGTTSVTEPAQTRDHTERALAAFGFDVDGRRPDRVGSTAASAARARRCRCPATFPRPRSGWSRPRRCPGPRRHRGRRPEPDAHGAHRRAAPVRRARRRARDGRPRPANRSARSSSRATARVASKSRRTKCRA